MIRLGPGNISLLGSGAHRAGGGKIRLGDFLLPGEALAGLEVERSVSGDDPSRTWEYRSPR